MRKRYQSSGLRGTECSVITSYGVKIDLAIRIRILYSNKYECGDTETAEYLNAAKIPRYLVSVGCLLSASL